MFCKTYSKYSFKTRLISFSIPRSMGLGHGPWVGLLCEVHARAQEHIQRKWVGLLCEAGADLTVVGGLLKGHTVWINYKWVGLVMDYSWWVELLMGHVEKVGWKSEVATYPCHCSITLLVVLCRSSIQWNLWIKDTLGAELLSSFWRLSFGGRFEPICNL